MEIQESVVRNIHVILGWQASPRYADFRGRLTEELREIAGPDNDWTWDGPMTAVTSEERGFDLALGPTELVIATESPGAELGDLPKQLATLVLEQLSIDQVRLIGAGSVWLAQVSSIEDLNAWLADQLGALGRPAIYDAFGGKPSSFFLQAEIGEDDYSYDIELKSATASDAAEADEFKSDEEEDFPPAALYLEVRRSEVGTIDGSLAAQAFADNLEKNLAAAQKFDSALREGL